MDELWAELHQEGLAVDWARGRHARLTGRRPFPESRQGFNLHELRNAALLGGS